MRPQAATPGRLVCAAVLTTGLGLTQATESPSQDAAPFAFALVADVQYGDKPAAGARRYADSLARLEAAVEDWSDESLAFTVQLGDVIDGVDDDALERRDLRRVLERFARAPQPVHHVVGNHCLDLPRAELVDTLGLDRSWYSFSRGAWRFLVVDSVWVSTAGRTEDDPFALDAARFLEVEAEAPNARPWNGSLGPAQRAWLADELQLAASAGQRVVVFSHLPVHVDSAAPGTLLWDQREVLAILERAPAFHAWIAGHHHSGGYAERAGRHFLTLRGMVEAPAGDNAYAVVQVGPTGLTVDGRGHALDRNLALSDAPLTPGAFTPVATEDSHPPRTTYRGREIARTMHWRGAEWLLRKTREEEEAPKLLLEALGVQAGTTVVDFGCGNGYHALPLAELVGPEGRVLGVDIQPEMLQMLRFRAREAGIENVESVQATALDTGLVPASADLVVMVDVYHELDRPELVLDSVRASLRGDGRLALVEFRAEDDSVPIKPEHKMTAAQVIDELGANGFALVERYDELPWQHLLIFRPSW